MGAVFEGWVEQTVEHDWLCFLEDNPEWLSAFHRYPESSRTVLFFNHQPARGPTVNLLYMGLCVIRSDWVKPEGHVDRKLPNTRGFISF